MVDHRHMTSAMIVTLELGGKSPMVVFPDAGLDRAIPGLASAIFFHQGQVCTARTRLYVHKSIHDRVVEGIAAEIRKLKIGHGLEPDTTMGPLISSAQLQKVMGYLDQGRQEGAETVIGGGRLGGAGFFMEPTVLTNTNDGMSVVKEEIFGPVLCAQAFDDEAIDAIAAKANETIFGLAASIWTRDLFVAHKMAKRIRAGSVWINAHNSYDPALRSAGSSNPGGAAKKAHLHRSQVGLRGALNGSDARAFPASRFERAGSKRTRGDQ